MLRELMDRALEGDAEARGEFFARARPYIRAGLSRILRGNQHVEGDTINDLESSCYEQVAKHWRRFDRASFPDDEHIERYLYVVGANCARTWLRQGRIKTGDTDVVDLSDPRQDPAATVTIALDVRRCVDERLADMDRKLLLLSVRYGYTADELVAKFQIQLISKAPAEFVRKRLERAKKIVRACLELG